MTEISITLGDLKRIEASRGVEHLGQVFERISTPQQLGEFLFPYIEWNSGFASAGMRLVSDCARPLGLFLERRSLGFERDCALDVAQPILAAVTGEFRDPDWFFSHRMLAELLRLGVMRFFGRVIPEFRQKEFLATFLWGVVLGYEGLQNNLSPRGGEETISALLRAIGFHLGSEYFADDEFNRLDLFLCNKFPDLVRYLKEETVINEQGIHVPYYTWVSIHKTVEHGHCTDALRAASLAIQHARGAGSPEKIKETILGGFRGFMKLQNGLMGEIKKIL